MQERSCLPGKESCSARSTSVCSVSLDKQVQSRSSVKSVWHWLHKTCASRVQLRLGNVQGRTCLGRRAAQRAPPAWPQSVLKSVRKAKAPCSLSATVWPQGHTPDAAQAQQAHLPGKESCSARSTSVCSVSLFCTMNCARSPTTLLLGVT